MLRSTGRQTYRAWAALLGFFPDIASACAVGNYDEVERIGHLLLLGAVSFCGAGLGVRHARAQRIASIPVVLLAVYLVVTVNLAVANFGICCDCGYGYRNAAVLPFLGALVFFLYEGRRWMSGRNAT